MRAACWLVAPSSGKRAREQSAIDWPGRRGEARSTRGERSSGAGLLGVEMDRRGPPLPLVFTPQDQRRRAPPAETLCEI